MAEVQTDPNDAYVPPTEAADEVTADQGSAVQELRDAKSGDAPTDHANEKPADGDDTVPSTNGDSKHVTIDSAAQAGDLEDEEMKDAEPTSASAPTTNGTPSGNKRASTSSSSKKKSSAVPEHKSKKLNKKKSRPMTNLGAQPGEHFFARMKGHPPWPSIVCDETMLPVSLLSTRPVTAAQPDGSYKRADFADGGKNASQRTFPIMFLHTNEFAWIPNTELTPLDSSSEAVTNPPEKGKSKPLLAAYAKAAEAKDLDHYKTMLFEHQKALQEDLALQEEREAEKEAKKAEKAERAEKAEKSKKAPRKSTDGAANGEENEMEVDEEGAGEKPKSKKRKKTAEETDADEKTPKPATKLKLSTPKQPAESTPKKKSSKPKTKPAKSDSEEVASTPKVEEKPLSPEALLEIKEKKVLYFRHKLQRGFLQRDVVLKAEEMKPMAEFLKELEGYPDLEASIIRKTKIHKVLKQMIKIENIPLEEEYKFKTRSMSLLSKWNDVLASDGGNAGDEKGEEKDKETKDSDKPSTTTAKAVDTTATEDAAAVAAAAPETASAADLEKKIGTTVEGEKEADDEKSSSAPKTAEEKKTDAPAIDSAPAEEYKPPADDA